MKKIFENAVWWSGVIMVGLILGISLQFVRAWTEPSQAPPGGNLGAPINTGNNLQTKIGSLVLGLLATDYISNSSLPTAKNGYVLTLTDAATGRVAWALPSGGGGGATTGSQEFTSSGTWHSPPGVTSAKISLVGGGGGGGTSRSGGYGWPGEAGKVVDSRSVAVNPNTDYKVIVGDPGSYGADDFIPRCNGTAGQKSSVEDISGATAGGGAGGVCSADEKPPQWGGYTNGTGYGTSGGGSWGNLGGAGTKGYVKIDW